MEVNKYRLRCVTENKDYTIWSEQPPVYCPSSAGHQVDHDATLLIETVKSNEVVTQFEKNDKDLKICSGYGDVDSNGSVDVSLPVPGDITLGNGRYIDAGCAWFDEPHPDDRVVAIECVDLDNVVGYGAGAILKTYHDDEQPETNRGWRIPYKRGQVEIDTMAGYGFIPSQLYLRIRAKRGGGLTTGRFYYNIKWGKLG
jgi:hypothetical protein